MADFFVDFFVAFVFILALACFLRSIKRKRNGRH